MEEKQCKWILDNLEQMKKGLHCIDGELYSDHIIGQKASFEYLDCLIKSLYEYIKEIATIVNKELES